MDTAALAALTGPAARHRRIALAALAACALALATAHGAERVMGLVPCAFCLLERWPYNIGAALATLALVVPRAAGRALLWLLLAALLCGAGLSLTHVGVEQHWWADPLPECTVPDLSGLTAAQRFAALPSRPAKPCEDPDFLIPGLSVSVTQMGLAYALAVSAGLAISLIRSRSRP